MIRMVLLIIIEWVFVTHDNIPVKEKKFWFFRAKKKEL
jgi:hypothetical protein